MIGTAHFRLKRRKIGYLRREQGSNSDFLNYICRRYLFSTGGIVVFGIQPSDIAMVSLILRHGTEHRLRVRVPSLLYVLRRDDSIHFV